jgi:alkylresorcinol/alkylpyrone synthase
LGCAAGAAGLARGADYCRAWPERRVLLVALECCSLTFLPDDLSNKNLVACALFGDGAAAALLAGDATDSGGPELLTSRSHLFPDSYRIMGWDFIPSGMQLVLSPQLPLLVRHQLAPLVAEFLAGCQLRQQELGHYLTHPGGARVLDAYAEALQLDGTELDLSSAILRDHGNVSSVTILLLLERWLATRPSGYALLSAFGPGFSAELSLLRG